MSNNKRLTVGVAFAIAGFLLFGSTAAVAADSRTQGNWLARTVEVAVAQAPVEVPEIADVPGLFATATIPGELSLLIGSAFKPVQQQSTDVVVTYARENEGVIRITMRVCGNATNWQGVAADNGIRPPVYLVLVNQQIRVNCASTTRAPAPAPAIQPAGWVHPLPGTCRPSGGGGQYLAPRDGYRHQGIDLGGIEGVRVGTPVRAAAAGTVVHAGWSGKAGIQVQIDHGNGVRTKYNHLSYLNVRYGQWVNPGQHIGSMGRTGNATGPHLHFEVWSGGSHQDPVAWLRSRGINLGC